MVRIVLKLFDLIALSAILRFSITMPLFITDYNKGLFQFSKTE